MKGEKCYGSGMLYVFLFVGLAAGLVSGVAIYAFAYPAFQSAEWAAWVQAIGSVGAIFAAIYVVDLQHRKASERALSDQKEAEKRLIEALGTEIALEWNQYVDLAGRHISRKIDGGALCYRWVPPRTSFPIYGSSAGNIALISDPKIRQNLIIAFSDVDRLYLAYRENNRCLDDLVALNEPVARNEPNARQLQSLAEERLGGATNVVRKAHRRARDSVTRAYADVLQVLGGDMLEIALLDDCRDQST